MKPKPKAAGADLKKRVLQLIDVLTEEFPDAKCALNFTNPLELLIATILAAQCTDKKVNEVTEALFKKYRSAGDYAAAGTAELEAHIHATGFFRNKTKSIKRCCQALVDTHGGEVPGTMKELTALGGVGRKTANVVLGNAFGIPGLVVDTHVQRLSKRIGLSGETRPEKVERDLMEIVPEKEWTHFSHLLTSHGRACCTARKPLCGECPAEHLCPQLLT
jgi:endonuclease-3